MFNDQNDASFQAIAKFVGQDKQIESNLHTNFAQYGEYGMEQTTYEIMSGLRRRFGDLDRIDKREIQRLLQKNYGFGVERYLDEYHRGVVTESDIVNQDFMLDENSVDNSKRRVQQASNQIEGLCEPNQVSKPNVCFGDYTNRSFGDIVNLIEARYGTNMAKQVLYYEHIIREPLENGLYDTLRQVKGNALNDVAELAHCCSKMEGIVQGIEMENKQQNTRLDNASMFK